MTSLPRRSARLSDLHHTQSSTTTFSASSILSSTSATSYPTPSDEAVYQQERLKLQLQSQLLQVSQPFQAPLPSPSVNESNSFFGYLQTQPEQVQNAQPTEKMPQQDVHQAHQQHGRTDSNPNPQQQAAQHHNSFSSQQRPNMQMGNNKSQLPADFLAEAARRAQIACLMRDMGDVTL